MIGWMIKVEIPLLAWSDWSKNRMWRHDRGGKVRLTGGARSRRNALAAMIDAQIAHEGGQRIWNNKLWLRIHVIKKNHLGDAHNIIDLVADAVEKGTGLNDRWYTFDGITWSIDPNDPKLVLEVGQRDTSDVLSCGMCGLLLPPSHFGRLKTGPMGRAHSCRSCVARRRRQRKTERAARLDHNLPPASLDGVAPWLT